MNECHVDCPGCGASVRLSEEEPISKCGFCQTQIALPPPSVEQVDHRASALAELDAWLDEAIRPYARRNANGYVIPPPESSVLGSVLTGMGAFMAMGSFFGGATLRYPLMGFAGMGACVFFIAMPGVNLSKKARLRYLGFKNVESEYLRRRETLERQFAN